MSTLKSTIEGLASQFAMSVIGALRSASIAEVMEVTSGGGNTRAASVVASSGAGAAAPVRRGPGRPKKVAAAGAAPSPTRASDGGGRLGRRSIEDIGKVVEDIVALLQKNPDGLRAEQIRSSLGVQAKELPRPLADGLADGRLEKSGQKRATTYFAASGGARGKKRK